MCVLIALRPANAREANIPKVLSILMVNKLISLPLRDVDYAESTFAAETVRRAGRVGSAYMAGLHGQATLLEDANSA